jgi:hypothetical protein
LCVHNAAARIASIVKMMTMSITTREAADVEVVGLISSPDLFGKRNTAQRSTFGGGGLSLPSETGGPGNQGGGGVTPSSMTEIIIINTGGGHHLYFDKYSKPCGRCGWPDTL